ncbi:thioesterase II family protein [Micromonospora sp. DT228]|uniref:thioesterase II family protein n=1 Tax=Micromonospora sp. DT228 TaxID=3393443 RepID=UPI003CE7CEAF
MSIGTERSAGAAPRTADLWLRTFRPAPQAAVRLICFPHAGGSASYYLATARALAPGIEVVAVQYPGRQDRLAERRIEAMPELAEAIFDAIGAVSGPIALFGHSMGATLAFEVAHRLEAAGRTPVCLIASGRRAPSRHRDTGLHLLDDDALLADLRRLSGTGAGILADAELMRLYLPVIRSDYRAIETCPPRADVKLRCPIVAIGGDRDPQASIDDVRAWADHAGEGFSFRAFSGGHFFLDDHASAILDLIRAAVRPSVRPAGPEGSALGG